MHKNRFLNLLYTFACFALVGAALLLIAFSPRPFKRVAHSPRGVATADIKVLGRSNLFKWSMEDKTVSCSARFTYKAGKTIPGSLASFAFSMPVHELTSGKSGMDAKAYDALKAKDGGTIAFTATGSTITQGAGDSFQVKSDGNLTIAGVTRPVVLLAACEVKADGMVSCTGTEVLKMSDYHIRPPTYMLGALRTVNRLTIAFSMEVVK